MTPWRWDLAWTIILLTLSNVFMTVAWYGHLNFKHKALWVVVLLSWGIAFFEYCLHVPANRIGSSMLSPPQLKVVQETITFLVFFVFSITYLRHIPTLNDALAFALVIGAVAISLFRPF